jgi:hypothetical protein
MTPKLLEPGVQHALFSCFYLLISLNFGLTAPSETLHFGSSPPSTNKAKESVKTRSSRLEHRVPSRCPSTQMRVNLESRVAGTAGATARSPQRTITALCVRRWAREGVLRPGYRGGWQWTREGESVASIQLRAEQDRVILIYRHRSGDAEWKDEQYPVRIVRTPCNLGSSRAWFICPAVGCGRRVAVLYGGGIFACRHCYRLAYASSREDAGGRATRRADRPSGAAGLGAGHLASRSGCVGGPSSG